MEYMKLKLKGSFLFHVEKENGEVITIYKDNLIVDSGFDFIADSLANAGSRPIALSHIGIGTDATAAATTDTTLGIEVDRSAATYAHTAGTKLFSMTSTHTGLTAAIVEAGLFNDAVVGTMFDRVTFPVINLQSGDTLTAKFTLTMS